jgi:1,4-alpha-glucan branching enzyme
MTMSDECQYDPCVFQDDPHLRYFKRDIDSRYSKLASVLAIVDREEGGLLPFSSGYEIFGLHKTERAWVIREYLPGAAAVSIIGDFNNWDQDATPLVPEAFGRWSVSVPLEHMSHGQKYKLSIKTSDGSTIHRVPAWARYTIQNKETNLFDAVVWDPPGGTYRLVNPRPVQGNSVIIYEAHIGMSSMEPKVSTYDEFRQNVLPRIARLGYRTIQLMAVMEHAYYGSFGYHVTSFFAPSSRFGTPDDLKRLIDEAHGLGISVLMDIIHSHMSNNTLDGIAALDGTDHCYTHAGPLGRHELWDSALFDYSKWETLRFLLSNCRYWIDEIGFDGFRFDGVTSMLYKHHGIGFGFSGDYNEYFGDRSAADSDACIYLMLANKLIHSLLPTAVTIAEDVSGMPLLCRPVQEGGMGFDYRLGMAIPDMWIKLLKEVRDEDWNMGHIVHTLTNRRWNEKTIAYAESHDQAIVGDKTVAMWLMDAAIYTDMSRESRSPIVERGIALHKMIRLISASLGNNGYLNFMGNEFGHPEWVDFPREGNGWSFHWCRRRWDLPDCGYLRYSDLESFDKAMISLVNKFQLLSSPGDEYVFLKQEDIKVISFERGGLLFVFNFHPTNCLVNFSVPTRKTATLRVLLDSDEARFGGYGNRISHSTDMHPSSGNVQVYIPPRCCAILGDLEQVDAYLS